MRCMRRDQAEFFWRRTRPESGLTGSGETEMQHRGGEINGMGLAGLDWPKWISLLAHGLKGSLV